MYSVYNSDLRTRGGKGTHAGSQSDVICTICRKFKKTHAFISFIV
jgi:hypothetical protein